MDTPTFKDYTCPLLYPLHALLAGECAVLVGHSIGVMSVALTAEALREKVAATVSSLRS